MVFSFLFISVALLLFPLLLPDLCSFCPPLPISAHGSDPLLLLELWDARLDTPLSYEIKIL